MSQDRYVRIYRLNGDSLIEIGSIDYESLYPDYDNSGIRIISKLNINSNDDIYYCCGENVYYSKLDGTLMSHHIAYGSKSFKMCVKNGIYWTWCSINDYTVKLFSISSDDISTT